MNSKISIDDPIAQPHVYPETEENPSLSALADHFVRTHFLRTRTPALRLVEETDQARALDHLQRYCGALIARTRVVVVSHPKQGDWMKELEHALDTPLRLESVNGLLPLVCACAYWMAYERDVYLSGLSVQPVLESLCGYRLCTTERLTEQTLRMWLPFLPRALDYLIEAHRVGNDGRLHISIPDLLCAEHISMLQRMERHVPGVDAFHHRDLEGRTPESQELL